MSSLVNQEDLIRHISEAYRRSGDAYDAGQVLEDIKRFPTVQDSCSDTQDLISREAAVRKTFVAPVDGLPRMVVFLDDIKSLPPAYAPKTGTWERTDGGTGCSECGSEASIGPADHYSDGGRIRTSEGVRTGGEHD